MFLELQKLGYKHYTANTVEDLELLPFNSTDITVELVFIQKWFREIHHIYSTLSLLEKNKWKVIIWKSVYLESLPQHFDTYEEAQYESIKKMLEIINK